MRDRDLPSGGRTRPAPASARIRLLWTRSMPSSEGSVASCPSGEAAGPQHAPLDGPEHQQLDADADDQDEEDRGDHAGHVGEVAALLEVGAEAEPEQRAR